MIDMSKPFVVRRRVRDRVITLGTFETKTQAMGHAWHAATVARDLARTLYTGRPIVTKAFEDEAWVGYKCRTQPGEPWIVYVVEEVVEFVVGKVVEVV